MTRRSHARNDSARLLATAARFVKTRWRRDLRGRDVYLMGDGEQAAQLVATEETATALFDVLASLPTELEAGERERRRLEERIEELQSQLAKRSGAAEKAAAAEPARGAKRDAATLEDVPLALVAPFRPTPDMVKAAKKDPLLALAVQAAKAMQPDATELDRARLTAMAFAASRRDMEGFWAASTQRSVKPRTR